MKATLLSGTRTFETIELPEPEVDDHSVLVRVGAVAICGSDLHGYLGGLSRFGPPTVLGHELAGTVEEVGSQVTSSRVGDRVFVDSILGCGVCRLCARGLQNVCPDYRVMGQSVELPGGLAGLVAVPEQRVHVLAPDVSMEAAAIIQPMSVAYHAAIDQGRIGEGDTVLVLGAGAIGDGVLLAAKDVGARVIVSDTIPYRLEVATALGADVVVDPSQEDVAAVVERETDGFGVDVAIEAVGASGDELVNLAIGVTGRAGRSVIVGSKLAEGRFPINEVKEHEKVIVGSQAFPDFTPAIVAEKIGDGSFPVERLITHRLAFAQVDEAFALLESRAGDVLKIVLQA